MTNCLHNELHRVLDAEGWTFIWRCPGCGQEYNFLQVMMALPEKTMIGTLPRLRREHFKASDATERYCVDDEKER